jgi:hypothetical protein
MRLACSLTVALAFVACSDPPEPFHPWELEVLTPSQGFSLRVPAFEVPAGHESQNCYFVRVPDLYAGADVLIDQVKTAINPGSHHMNVFRVKTLVDLRPEDGVPIKLGDYDATVIEGATTTSTTRAGRARTGPTGRWSRTRSTPIRTIPSPTGSCQPTW